jgi:hypothetical protein
MTLAQIDLQWKLGMMSNAELKAEARNLGGLRDQMLAELKLRKDPFAEFLPVRKKRKARK